MRILQICSAREIGGGERHLIDLAASLVHRRHEVFAAVSSGSRLINELSFLPSGNLLQLPANSSFKIFGVGKLIRFVRANKVHVIHAHAARDYPLASIAARRSGNTPFVLTRHVLFPMKRIHRFLLRRAGRIIAVSGAVREALAKQGIVEPDRIVTIYNGIPVERFAPEVSDVRRPDRLTVGLAGHLSPIKGQDIFVRAAEVVAAARGDVDFVLAGEDKARDGANRRSIEVLVDELGLRKRVRFAGWMDDIAEFYRGLDLFVSASRSEPFGLAMIEAMAAGVPVIASASEGAREIIDDGVTGRLVPIEDVQALADSMMDLLHDHRERDRLRENALAMVKNKFSIEKMVDATMEVYESVTGNREKQESGRV